MANDESGSDPSPGKVEGLELPSKSGHPVEWALERAAGFAAILSDAGLPTGTAAFILQHTAVTRLNRRWFGFVEEMFKMVVRHEKQLNREFWATQEWEYLLEEVVTKAAETRQKEMLDAYRNLFVNTVIGDDPSFDEAAEISALLSRWQPSHVQFLGIMIEGIGRVAPRTAR